jgi:hypothetical protein
LLATILLKEEPSQFARDDYFEHLTRPKSPLIHIAYANVTLYKVDAERCEAGGVPFVDFAVDADFNHCKGRALWVDVSRLKISRYKRYIEVNKKE